MFFHSLLIALYLNVSSWTWKLQLMWILPKSVILCYPLHFHDQMWHLFVSGIRIVGGDKGKKESGCGNFQTKKSSYERNWSRNGFYDVPIQKRFCCIHPLFTSFTQTHEIVKRHIQEVFALALKGFFFFFFIFDWIDTRCLLAADASILSIVSTSRCCCCSAGLCSLRGKTIQNPPCGLSRHTIYGSMGIVG